jgi:hypothetical protein
MHALSGLPKSERSSPHGREPRRVRKADLRVLTLVGAPIAAERHRRFRRAGRWQRSLDHPAPGPSHAKSGPTGQSPTSAESTFAAVIVVVRFLDPLRLLPRR